MHQLGLPRACYVVEEQSYGLASTVQPVRGLPRLERERTVHSISVDLVEAQLRNVASPVLADRFTTSDAPSFRQHWAWYPRREWEALRRKMALQAERRAVEHGLSTAVEALRPCLDIRFDGLSGSAIVDEDLGTAAAQLKLIGLLYLGYQAPSVISHQSSVISHQSSVISGIRHESSAISHQSSAMTHQTSDISHQASGIRRQSSVISHQSSPIRHQPSSISYPPSAIHQ